MINNRCEQNCRQRCLVDRIRSGEFDAAYGIQELGKIFNKERKVDEITQEIWDGISSVYDERARYEEASDLRGQDFDETIGLAIRPDEEGYQSVFQTADSGVIEDVGESYVWTPAMRCMQHVGKFTVSSFVMRNANLDDSIVTHVTH
jgi:hypothetical protein